MFTLPLAAALGCSAPPAPPPSPAAVGARAVDFTVEGSDGEPLQLSAHEGDVILLDLSGFH